MAPVLGGMQNLYSFNDVHSIHRRCDRNVSLMYVTVEQRFASCIVAAQIRCIARYNASS